MKAVENIARTAKNRIIMTPAVAVGLSRLIPLNLLSALVNSGFFSIMVLSILAISV